MIAEMFLCAFAILTLFHSTWTGDLVSSAEGNNCSSTGDPSESSEMTEQFISNLTVTDVRSILEILMVTFEKQPNLSTLKLLQMLINNLIKQNVPTEQLHRNFLAQLGHYEKLTNLLGNISLDNSSETFSDATDSPTTPFPFTKIQLLSLFTPYNDTTASTEKSDTSTNLSTVTTKDFSTFTTETIVSTLQEGTETTTILTTTNNNIFNQTDLALRSVISKRSKNSNQQDTLEIIDLPQEIDPLSQEDLTTKSNFESTYQADHLFEDNATLSTGRKSEIGKLKIEQNNQDAKSFSAQMYTKMFPQLTEFLLKTLGKLKIKFVRTYSESFEPADGGKTINRLARGREKLLEFSPGRENMYINEPLFRSRKSRSVVNFKENPDYLNDERQHSLNVHGKELSSNWYKLFEHSRFATETEDYSNVLLTKISQPKHFTVSQMDVHSVKPVYKHNIFNKHHLIINKDKTKKSNKYEHAKQASIRIINNFVHKSNADLSIEDLALMNANRRMFGVRQNNIDTIPTLRSQAEDACSATKKSEFDATKQTIPVLRQTTKSPLVGWTRKDFLTTDTSQEITTRKPLRPPGTSLSRRIWFFLRSL